MHIYGNVNRATGKKSKSFMEMIKSANGGISQDDDLDEEEEFVLKKEPSPAVTITHECMVCKPARLH